MISALEAEEFRLANMRIVNLAQNDLQKIFESLDITKPAASRDLLVGLVPELVTQYGDITAAMAAEWYSDMREASGAFTALPADSFPTEQVQASTRALVGGLFTEEPNTALVTLNGMLQRLVLNASRLTIVDSANRDPAAAGWKRVVRVGGCDFCRMLAGRGGVYKKSTATFASHDHCTCIAVPEWGDAKEVPVSAYKASERMEKVRQRAADPTDPKKQAEAQRVLARHRKRTREYLQTFSD
jgi:hypothetical protein